MPLSDRLAASVHLADAALVLRDAPANPVIEAACTFAGGAAPGDDLLVLDQSRAGLRWRVRDVVNADVLPPSRWMGAATLLLRRHAGAPWSAVRATLVAEVPRRAAGPAADELPCLVFPEMLPLPLHAGLPRPPGPRPSLRIPSTGGLPLHVAGIGADRLAPSFDACASCVQLVLLPAAAAREPHAGQADAVFGPAARRRLGDAGTVSVARRAAECVRILEELWGTGRPIRIALLDPEDVPDRRLRRRLSGACVLPVPRRLKTEELGAPSVMDGVAALSQALWDGACRVRGAGWREVALALTLASGIAAVHRVDPDFPLERLYQRFGRYPVRRRVSDALARLRLQPRPWRANMRAARIAERLDSDAGLRVGLREILARAWGSTVEVAEIRDLLAVHRVPLR